MPFPPLRLILDVQPKEEQPARTPWWLMLLRLLTAALFILAMAGPVWNPPAALRGGNGPLLVLIDDTWGAAHDWEARVEAVRARLATAGREGRPVALAATSEGAREVLFTDAPRALERLRALKPQPFISDRMAAAPAIETALRTRTDTAILWVTDGLAGGNGRAFAERLASLAPDRVEVLTHARSPRALADASNETGALNVRVMRAAADGPAHGMVRAVDLKGLTIGETSFTFGDALETQAHFDLPIELRNEIARLEITGEKAAGAVTLLDDRWKRRRVGVISGASADVSQPLLSPSYYVTRALGPFADAREERGEPGEAVLRALDNGAAVLILTDVGNLAGPAHDRLARFVEDGGVLIRFAGTRLSAASDDLVPVRLRRGGRVLGGSLSWETPKKLAPFERTSPFFGAHVADEVTVTRQVLAEPEPGLAGKTWASLADGTPLVTAGKRGEGTIVLFHITADTTWSNLPLSGLFVDMLRRITAMAGQPAPTEDTGTVAGAEQARATEAPTAAPTRTLDGFGAFGAPPVTARPIPASYEGPASADHPPGFYGPPEALVAVNPLQPGETIAALDVSGLPIRVTQLANADPVDLRGLMLALALLGLIADGLASLLMGGAAFGRRRPATAAASLLLALALLPALAPQRAQAQTNPPAASPRPEAPTALSPRDMEAVLKTRLAYIVTGNAQVDEASRLGLGVVSRALAMRTSLSPGEPMGVDPARDELAFYPMIYWPIVAGQPMPPAQAITRIASYMKQGGTILFDTRDALTRRPGGQSPESRWLADLLAGVDVPEIEPVPRDHVVTKTFYLLDGFIGRTTTGETWIEALPPPPADGGEAPARAGDSVSPIIITSNDLAAAWAADNRGQPLYPLVPGGSRQREMAIRGGVNLVMYTLTGNYKADQVHVRDLLERLSN